MNAPIILQNLKYKRPPGTKWHYKEKKFTRNKILRLRYILRKFVNEDFLTKF